MSYGYANAQQMGIDASVELAVDDLADIGNDITTAVVVLRDAVRAALTSNGFAKDSVDKAIENFGRVQI